MPKFSIKNGKIVAEEDPNDRVELQRKQIEMVETGLIQMLGNSEADEQAFVVCASVAAILGRSLNRRPEVIAHIVFEASKIMTNEQAAKRVSQARVSSEEISIHVDALKKETGGNMYQVHLPSLGRKDTLPDGVDIKRPADGALSEKEQAAADVIIDELAKEYLKTPERQRQFDQSFDQMNQIIALVAGAETPKVAFSALIGAAMVLANAMAVEQGELTNLMRDYRRRLGARDALQLVSDIREQRARERASAAPH